jgi:hypothetical protein
MSSFVGVVSPTALAPALLLWPILLVFFGATLFWVFEIVALAWPTESPPVEHGPEAVQVRIFTVDGEAVVQHTVDELPDALTDVHVIAESPVDVTGATVHVVPDDFECRATRKGRALEWARRHVSTDREYVLFLDEDTLVRDFEGLPDADVVQFNERPARTGSLLTYLSELFRMGFQIEQRAFSRLSLPLYAWGGGIAIRTDVESETTWNFQSLVEDTAFVWRAMREDPSRTFACVDAEFENQAPPTIRSMISQRRRWMAGSLAEGSALPLRYTLLHLLRNVAWALSPVAPFVLFGAFVFSWRIPFPLAFSAVSVVLLAALYAWSLVGWWSHRESIPVGALLLALTPLVTVLHSAGALYGLVSSPSDFVVTEKVSPDASRDRDSTDIAD